MCGNTLNVVRKNLVYFYNLSKLAARWILSPTCVQFLDKHRNPVFDMALLMILNLIKSPLMGNIQYLCIRQSVCTHTSN